MPLTGPAYGLQGTLDMMSGLPVVRSQQEADEALAAIQRDQAARQAAEASAFSAFQGAQGQAPPAPTALDALPQFFSNIASIASQRPEFAERRERSTAQQRAELLARRQENLRTLEGRYQDLAKRAQEIDPVKALEYSEKVDKLHKEQEKLFDLQKQSAQSVEAEKTRAAGLEEARIREKGAADRARLGAETDLKVAKIAASSRIDVAELKSAYGEGGLLRPDQYDKHLTTLRRGAITAKQGGQKAAATSALHDFIATPKEGENIQAFYRRLKAASHPYETERGKGKGTPKVAKRLYSPEEARQLMQLYFPDEYEGFLNQLSGSGPAPLPAHKRR